MLMPQYYPNINAPKIYQSACEFNTKITVRRMEVRMIDATL